MCYKSTSMHTFNEICLSFIILNVLTRSLAFLGVYVPAGTIQV